MAQDDRTVDIEKGYLHGYLYETVPHNSPVFETLDVPEVEEASQAYLEGLELGRAVGRGAQKNEDDA